MAPQFSWLERRPVTPEVTGSNPVGVAKGRFPIPRSGKVGRGRGDEKFAFLGNSFLVINCCRYLNVCLGFSVCSHKGQLSNIIYGPLAHLGERQPCKLEVTGSSPVWSTICFIGPREGRRRVKPEMLVRVQRGTDYIYKSSVSLMVRTHEVIGVVSVRVRYGEISPSCVSKGEWGYYQK